MMGVLFVSFSFCHFFPLLPRSVGLFCRPVVQTGNLFCWNCAEDNLVFVFSHPKTPSIHVFLSSFWHILCYSFSPVVLQRKTQIFPVESCHLQPVPYYDFYSLTLRIMFSFPFRKVPVQMVRPLVRLLTHWDTLVLPGVGLNVNLNTRGANSVTAYLHIQAHKEHQSAILAPALFSLQTEVEPGTGTGAWEKDQRRLLHCVLWGWLLLTLLG